MKLATLLQVAV